MDEPTEQQENNNNQEKSNSKRKHSRRFSKCKCSGISPAITDPLFTISLLFIKEPNCETPILLNTVFASNSNLDW